MTKPKLNTKLGSAIAVAAGLVLAGTIASASAARDDHPAGLNSSTDGYTKEQCKDGGWKDFKNPDGSQMFKNQGQCVSFFTSNGHHGNNQGNQGNEDDQGNNNQGHQQASFNSFFGQLFGFLLSFFDWFGNLFSSVFAR